MRIANLYISNFLGVAEVDTALLRPVALFCGRNGAGKSSVRDAVALALTADLGRVALKKDAPQLIHDGAEAAVVAITDADGDDYRVTISRGTGNAGKITDSQAGRKHDPALPLVLDAQRFTSMTEQDRRAFLFALMQLKTDQKAIVARLLAKGCDAAKVERIAPMLRSGFEAASKDAKGKATEAKGQWRQLTGEAYGSEKGKTWQAAVPPRKDEGNIPTLQTTIKHADAAMATWNQTIGNLNAEKTRRATLAAKLPALDEHAEKVERIRKKLATDEQVLRDLEADITATTAAAGGGPRVGLVHDLAAVLDRLLDHGERMHWFADSGDDDIRRACRQQVDAYEREHGKIGASAGNPDAAARLPALRQAHVTSTSAVANSRRDLEAAIGAGTEAKSIRAELAVEFDEKALAEATATVNRIHAERTQAQAQLDTLAALKREADAAAQKTLDAAALHQAVQHWDAIGDALSPDGIPAELLAEALDPLNQRLLQSAIDTEWSRVAIQADMRITAGQRSYRLLSESEQWRADAQIAEAIAHLSGVRLLVLDRFDVLDTVGRAQALAWFSMLADTGEIDTALLFATLREAPQALPEHISAIWIHEGVAQAERRELAEA